MAEKRSYGASPIKYEFVLPRSFQPADFLPLRLATRADDARWLVSQIVRKTANRDVAPWGCVRLHSGVLRRVMVADRIADIVRALEGGGAVSTAPYHAGVKAKGYRLAQRFLGDRCVRVPVTDPVLRKRIEAENNRQQQDQRTRWKPIHYMLDDEQQAVTITTDADVILDELPDHTRLCQDVLADRIRRRELPFSVSSTGRVFNSITGLKSDLRTALRLGGEPTGSVDIRCAQPSLLAMLMQPGFPANGVKGAESYKDTLPGTLPRLPASALALLPSRDSETFSNLASDGSLYDHLMVGSGLSRDALKLSLLRDVLARRGVYPSATENAFRAGFPTVLKIIREVNRHDHGTLIRLLQRAESWLVIERVAPRLLGRVPTITLHDAIYSEAGGVDTVADAFGEVFREIGFRFRLKREGGRP